MRTAICLLLAGFFLMGCEGVVSNRAEVKAPSVATSSTRWAQYCTFNGSSDIEEINHFLAEQGDHGWELVGIAGAKGTIYCFKSQLDAHGSRSEASSHPPSPMQTPNVEIRPQSPIHDGAHDAQSSQDESF